MYLIKSLYNYFFPKPWSDEEKLEFINQENLLLTGPYSPTHAACYQRTGVITQFFGVNGIIIDDIIFFDKSYCGFDLNLNDNILYLCQKDSNNCVIVKDILKNYGRYCGEEKNVEETSYDVLERTFIGEIINREGRTVFIKDTKLKFNIDDCNTTFEPIQGDWLELLCKVQFDKEMPMNISMDTVVEVISFKALRTKVSFEKVTAWDGETGICSDTFYFDRRCIDSTAELAVSVKVLIEAVESNQGRYSWRVTRMYLKKENIPSTILKVIPDTQRISFEEEENHNVDITYPKFENLNIKDNASIPLNITNNRDQSIILNKWIMIGSMEYSQVNIKPFLTEPTIIYPGQTFSMTIICHPKFFGRRNEHLIIIFEGFKVERFIEINVIACSATDPKRGLDEFRRLYRRVPFGLGLSTFPIPENVWDAVLGDSNDLTNIETKLPFMMWPLSIHNYKDKFHTLIYMEDIELTVNMRNYNMSRVFLNTYKNFLGIKIIGLAERRPSLIVGDKVVVKEEDKNEPSYIGYIKKIEADLVLIKFEKEFHERYLGGDVSLKFFFDRIPFRRAHLAINYAIFYLGVDVLFPNCIQTRPFQIPLEKLETITWYNKNLNNDQKSAVRNILLGECRPMPYCIYGPPGTGKTTTVIETILQILNNNPDSRILIATPCNNAANVIAEKLLMYKDKLSFSMVRIIAKYLVAKDTIPDVIWPYCATVNIHREYESSNMTDVDVNDGMNLNMPASHIARYRVSISTCYALSPLAKRDLPDGHYTHIIVDEAAQASEPEIMIPLTFINKVSGQIILAGDPMSLGPTVISKYGKKLGYAESFMMRVLDMYPYKKDYLAFGNGYNSKFITSLTENYRSLEEVIEIPKEMFYDSSLVAKLPRHLPWVGRVITAVSDLFENTDEHKTGGIFVYGIKGQNTRSEVNSWLNREEASVVGSTMCKLYSKNVMADEIGIITPYIAQIKHLRHLFHTMKLQQPKIGTVEVFQGEEKPLILLSAVRTDKSLISEDQKYNLGILTDPRRFNVALTRAQVAIIIFCDPHLLSTDYMWREVIKHAIENKKYLGCDVPAYTD